MSKKFVRVTNRIDANIGFFSEDIARGYFGAGAIHPVGVEAHEQYYVAVYWAITTMSTVGYGNLLSCI